MVCMYNGIFISSKEEWYYDIYWKLMELEVIMLSEGS